MLAATTAQAQSVTDDLPIGTVFNDSLEVVEDSTQLQVGIVDTKIHLLSRTYGDSIVLRWAPEDYATWRYVNRVGMDVLRYSEEHPFEADTLASRLRPLTLEQFRQRYPTTDTLAMMAAGLLYDENRTRPTATKNPPGTLGSLHEIYQEQQMRFGLALMTTEWRRDLAEALAMRLVDRTAKRGKTYEYIVRPSEIDTSGQIIVRTGHIPEVKNERYKPEPFVTTLTDTTIAENTVQLTWNRGKYSTFEIERRPALDHSRQRREASGAWERVNDKPYIDMSPNELGEADSLYTMTDQVPQLGCYEYRLQAHDVFGDLTEPTKPFRVWVRDITPPSAPTITLITIDRRDSTDLSKGVFATFHLRKDTLEQDYLGWHLVYYHERETSRQWRRLSQQMAAADSLLTLDVTGFSTGMVAVAATDTAGNVGYSIPQLLRIEDLKAPGVPTNLRAEGNAEEGTITLTWDAPEEADIDYYEVAYANDTTHRWVLATEAKLQDTRFVDSVDVTVNQKYIYYKVRAIDYSTNQSPDVQLQVLRPTRLKPQVAHLLESSADSAGIHMKWACSNEQIMDRHVLMRRLRGEEKWDTLGIFSADSIRAADNVLEYHDRPAYNRKQDYQYCVESFSCFDISSGLSLLFTITYQGPRIQQIPVRLEGAYLSESHETRLTWEINEGQAVEGDWYICIYRKGPRDDSFQFHISVPADTKERRSSMLAPGQSEEYYIKLQFKDGRESLVSNKVSVSRPKPANGE